MGTTYVIDISAPPQGAGMDVDYDRISFDRTGAGAGVESQHDENAEWAEQEGRPLHRSYVDNDVSAYSGVERPAYLRLLADMRAGLIASVTIWHANRLHRNTEELPAFIRTAREHGVKLYSTTKGEQYNLSKASGRRQLRDDTSAAEYESEHRGERVAMARKRQARNGDWGGGPRAFGWGVDTGRVRSVCVNPKAPTMDRRYQDRPVLDMSRHNPAEAEEIRRWRDELLAGVPQAQILRDLARRQVPTVSMTDGRTLRRGGRVVASHGWDGRTLQQILTSPRTAGHSVYDGEIVRRDVYPPIISEDERQALITLFSDPSRKTSPGNTPKWLGALIYQCGRCGNGAVMTCRRVADGRRVYRCQYTGHNQWDADGTDAAMVALIIGRLSGGDLAALIKGPVKADLPALRRERQGYEQQMIECALKAAQKKITFEQLEVMNAYLEDEITKVAAKIDAATVHSPVAEFADADTAEDARAIWDGLTLGRKREVLRFLFTVTLPPIGRGKSFSASLIQVRKVRHRAPRQAAA